MDSTNGRRGALMALEALKSLKNSDLGLDDTPFNPTYNYENEPFLQHLGRAGLTGLAHIPDIAALPGSAAQWAVNKIAGTPGLEINAPGVPTFEKMKRGRQEIAGKYLPDINYLEPNDILTKFASFIGSDLPFIVASGGTGLVKRAIQSAGSAIGMIGAEEAGLGPIGQFVGGLVGGGSTQFIPKITKNIKTGALEKSGQALHGMDTLTEFGQKSKSGFYEKAHEIGKKLNIPVEDLESTIDKELSLARRKLPDKDYQELFKEVKSTGETITRGKMTGEDLLLARRKFNTLIGRVGPKSDKGQIYTSIHKKITDAVEKGKSMHVGYGQNVTKADRLQSLLSNQGQLRSWLEKTNILEGKNPITRLLLGGPASLGGLTGIVAGRSFPAAVQGAAMGAGIGATAVLGAKLANTTLRGAELVIKNPIIAKHLGKIMAQVGKNQFKQLPYMVSKLDKDVRDLTGNGEPYDLKIVSTPD